MQSTVLRHKTKCAQYLTYAQIAVTDSIQDSIQLISRSQNIAASDIADAIELERKRTLPSPLVIYQFENDIQDMNNSILSRKRARPQDKYLMMEWNENHHHVQKKYKRYQQAICDEIQHLEQEYELRLIQYNQPNAEKIQIDHSKWQFPGTEVCYGCLIHLLFC